MTEMESLALVEEAYQQKKIGLRQYKAMKKHAPHHTPAHIAVMIRHLEHKTFKEAHKQALKEAGE